MRDLAINPRKGRKKDKAVMPVVTTLLFFLFFCSFAKMSYVRFLPVGNHLGNALLFQD